MINPEPPEHLGDAGRALWTSIQRSYGIGDAGGLAYLVIAAEALDRARQAQAILRAEGLVITGARGGLIAHPAVAVERDSLNLCNRSLRELRLPLAGVQLP